MGPLDLGISNRYIYASNISDVITGEIKLEPFNLEIDTKGISDIIIDKCKETNMKRNAEIKNKDYWRRLSLTPEKIIRNGPATIVFWPDKTKTVVKCAEGETMNQYTAFCAALAKKIFGNNSRVNRIAKMCKEEK